jgi:hypothetical protein
MPATEKILGGKQETQLIAMTNRKIQYWVIPPKADAEFVAATCN